MSSSADLKLLFKSIMATNVLRMGGASAGILGLLGADNDIVNNLKTSTVAFASEYRKPKPDRAVLEQLSYKIYGFLQTLQLTHTLSEEAARKLIDQLQSLMVKISA